jgi:glycosyltransferase involved in cell wall biosynthesis
MRLIYPLLWSRLGREACQEQSVNTAAALARLGVEVTLLMPRGPRDPELSADEIRAWFDVEGDFGVVQRPSRRIGETIVPSALWLGQLCRDPQVRRADLVYSRIPLMLGAGTLLPVPFATDHYKPWPDQWPLLRPFIKRTARHPLSLGFVLHSGFAADSFRRLGIEAGKILVAHNGADPRRMQPCLGKEEARARVGLPGGRPIALYAGRINAEKGLDQLLALADRRPETLFVMVGSEGEGPVERAAAARANLCVLPWQAPADLLAFLYAADILLIPPSSAPLERFGNCVLPMKIFSYLAAGRPILAPRAPDTAELLEDGANALLVEPDKVDAAAAALDRLLAEPALAARLGANAATLARSLTWDARAGKIARFLETRLSAA